jgi:hypothetical protein
MKLNINFISRGHFWAAGEEIPSHVHIPVWCIRKHRCGEAEAFELRECRRLRREMLERQKATLERKAASITPSK